MHVVAIDGPAGSGKSSVSKAAAAKLGFGYLDTGAAYRALTWAALKAKLSAEALTESWLQEYFDYSISLDPNDYWVKVAGLDLTERIRETHIAENVSGYAKQPIVRKFMLETTKSLVKQCNLAGIIVEGRDITTVVLPDAKTRILLTASPEVRLERRSKELTSGADALNQVTQRDKSDSQIVDFMHPAPGVTLIDSTNMDFDETVAAVIATITSDRR